MKTEEKKRIYLKEYSKPDFAIDGVELRFEIFDDRTLVHNQMRLRRLTPKAHLVLEGENLKLLEISIDDQKINPGFKDEKSLCLSQVPDQFVLRTSVEIHPHLNTDLEGLYKTGTNFLTQCEAQGFRKITYFMDRPDVMTHYTVTLEADKSKCPVLLSNGDLISTKNLPDNRHQAVWRDPHKKPCYLFALVAGQFGRIEKPFTTMSGRKVKAQVFCTPGMESRCEFALESLLRSMKWDEERFGREYDLDTYMLVAADDFNAGAMENKGLNIFNSRLVYADPKTASDGDYYAIESVVAHEYFHNWTGNRVTLRDWFHLSLKEGLTVFRDQEFSMDLSSRSDVRISSVQDLREDQFAEDSGPNAHPIRPTSCYAVDNFFTATIYEKGSEVIRMMQTMVGRPGFRKGMDLYFERHDGNAVIIEDFAKAISDANHQNWEQFKLWYEQAGTPQIHVHEKFENGTYELTLKQSCPPTARETAERVEKKPFHIPLVIGLLDSVGGEELSLENTSALKNSEGQYLLHLTQAEQSWSFRNLKNRPVLSLNRQFSAPVQLHWEAKTEDLILLLKKDTDAFNRWEAGQKLFILELQKAIANPKALTSAGTALIEALKHSLKDHKLESAMKARLLDLPGSAYLIQLVGHYHPENFEIAYRHFRKQLAVNLEPELLDIYKKLHGHRDQEVSHSAFAERRLKNQALSLLSELPQHLALVEQQWSTPAHMTDEQVAFSLALDQDKLRDQAIEEFYQRWQKESLTLNKWFSLVASSWHPATFETVKKLSAHPAFDSKNPNRNYALLRTFGGNLERFHSGGAEVYQWYADKIVELDPINCAVATRLASEFNIWVHLPPLQKAEMRKVLDALLAKKLSDMTYEVIKNCRSAEA
jgi:aminopeptidase N